MGCLNKHLIVASLLKFLVPMFLLYDVKWYIYPLFLFFVPFLSFICLSWQENPNQLIIFSNLGVMNSYNEGFISILSDWAIQNCIVLLADALHNEVCIVVVIKLYASILVQSCNNFFFVRYFTCVCTSLQSELIIESDEFFGGSCDSIMMLVNGQLVKKFPGR